MVKKHGVAEYAAQGGNARAAKLSTDERRRIARLAAVQRWARAGKTPLPQALRTGPLKIGEIEFDCAVLDDKQNTRVVSETRFMAAMGMYRSGALSTRRGRSETGAREPLFLAYKNLKPYIDKHLGGVHFKPLQYRTPEGGVSTTGIRADLIPKICEVWIDADRAGVLGHRQQLIAKKTDILLRGFAHVGIIALIDEATGWQNERARFALAKILEAFIAKEFRKWVKTFPIEYYQELCRLRSVPFPRESFQLPSYFGYLTNDLIYSRLAPGVLAELRKKNPVVRNGYRRHKFFQWLTDDIGDPKLRQHLWNVITLMKASDNWDQFKAMVDKALPPYSTKPLLALSEQTWAVGD